MTACTHLRGQVRGGAGQRAGQRGVGGGEGEDGADLVAVPLQQPGDGLLGQAGGGREVRGGVLDRGPAVGADQRQVRRP